MSQIKIPEKILKAFQENKTYYAIYGGRAGAKSESVGRLLLIEASNNPLTILCCRETQSSINDSVHALLKYIINLYDMKGFTVLEHEIRHGNGSRFIFRGLKKESVGSVKSIPNIAICWVEEAQYISRHSLDILVPTIRNNNSKIIFTFNPDSKTDPVYNDYVLSERNDVARCLVNYYDNPFVSEKTLNDMMYDKNNDIEKYNNIWLGECKNTSDAVIFKNRYIIESYETPSNVVFYFGADWGDTDPNTLIRCFIVNDNLYIDYEMYEIGQDIDKIPEAYEKIPKSREYKIRADNTRPGTINYVKKHGFNIVGEPKLKIEDGIAYLKHFKQIIIHSRCKNIAYEMSVYSRKIDNRTGEILEEIIDKNNHCIDALRYALYPLIIQKSTRKTFSVSANIY